ncbi:hypothetical protein TNCV_5033721 [Trichonephila clavipes]|nr:hypothetical protein TNCV_5033721 [Trichonephila clavipes]
MDKCVQKWDKELWRLGPLTARCVLACYAQIGRGRPRDFCDLPIRRTRGVLRTHPQLKGSFSGDEEKKKKKGAEERKARMEKGKTPAWMEKARGREGH